MSLRVKLQIVLKLTAALVRTSHRRPHLFEAEDKNAEADIL